MNKVTPMSKLVIVESPTKARTIERFLAKDYEVLASYGHVRDLPGSAAEIPAEIKKQKWSRLGINVNEDFAPLYIIPAEKEKRVNELKRAVKSASEVYLATDEDREGESISWHLLEVLKPKVPVKRLVFHEITKTAIEESLANARTIDSNLVRAQETRRIIDRLYGYEVSPLLWKKMVPRLSAGRVQSVAMRLLVERERERARFKSAEFWDLKALFTSANDPSIPFEAQLTHIGGKRVAGSKDFDPNSGAFINKPEVVLLRKDEAEKLVERLRAGKASIGDVETKPFTQKPYPPFTTSTLQQEASRKLGFGAKRTMSVAQTLYENGLITYMRTDSTSLSNEALTASRTLISKEFGPEFLHPEPRTYKTKVKNAQEAHEAIRPAGTDFASPSSVRDRLGIDAFRLYELIWKRMLACQMKDAEGTRVSVEINSEEARFRASGKTITFPGFLRAYVEGSDDPEGDLAEQERVLPPLKSGETLSAADYTALQHFTQPPPRYTEGSLIKELERLGIGRPSTWATIVDVVLSRDYAFKKGSALVPTFLAIGVTGLLEGYFAHLVDYQFTASLEDDLDAIARGEKDNLEKLKSFYFGLAGDSSGLKDLVEQGTEKIDPRIVCGLPLGKDEQNRDVEIRIGRYGPFLSNGETRASIPDATPYDEMNVERACQLLAEAAKGPEALGADPSTGEPVYLKKGRFGPYIQRGEMVEGGEKPKMASLLPGMSPESVNLDVALQLLSLPKDLGKNPENNEDIQVFNGRYGPYVKCGSESRTIPTEESPLTITIERAIELLKQPRTRGRASSQPKTLREIGKNPATDKVIVIKQGRYGPYVTDGEINASLTQGMAPEAVTIEEAISLLEARAAKGPSKGRRRKAAAPKSAAAKTAKKKVEKEPKVKAEKETSTKKAPAKKTATKKTSTKKSTSKKVSTKDKAVKE
jgi:DNA topoisomerase-1